METTNMYLQLLLLGENPCREKDLLLLVICLNPPTAGSQLPPRALSPLLSSLCDAEFTCSSVEVYYGRAVYTNLLYYSPCPVHHYSLYLCCLHAGEQKRESGRGKDQCRAERRGGCEAGTCSEELTQHILLFKAGSCAKHEPLERRAVSERVGFSCLSA